MTDKPIGNPATNMVHRERRQTDLTPQERKWPESELVKQARRLQAAEAERDRLAARVEELEAHPINMEPGRRTELERRLQQATEALREIARITRHDVKGEPTGAAHMARKALAALDKGNDDG